jgi:hypothetical protein
LMSASYEILCQNKIIFCIAIADFILNKLFMHFVEISVEQKSYCNWKLNGYINVNTRKEMIDI